MQNVNIKFRVDGQKKTSYTPAVMFEENGVYEVFF